MYVAFESIRLMIRAKQPAFSPDDPKTIDNFKKQAALMCGIAAASISDRSHAT
jgi:hypothetical protein